MSEEDPYLWLEEVEGEEAIDWVKTQNKETLDKYEGTERFSEIEKRSLEILDSKEKLAYPQFVGDQVYNFWRDEKYERGLIRRMPLQDYLAHAQDWEEVLDLDRLAEEEGENWVYKGQQILSPDNDRSMLWLSRGGSDACVVREFDLVNKQFVQDGFIVPEAKSDLSWKDPDTLYLGTRFDDDSMTESGYPRVIKVWKRGTPLEQASFLFEVQKQDLAIGTWVSRRPEGTHDFVSRSIDFWNEENYFLKDGKMALLILPTDAPIRGFFHGLLLLTPRSPWGEVPAGALAAVVLEDLLLGTASPVVLYDPGSTGTIESVSCLKDTVLVAITKNVQTTLHQFTLGPAGWSQQEVQVKGGGCTGPVATSVWRNDFFLSHEDFVTPTTLYYHDGGSEHSKIKSLPERFNSQDLVCEQLWVESPDGTRVPYYILYKEQLPLGANTPAVLYGYGGFEVSLLPRYLSLVGANWLEQGGIYISANIRGGGEFGPTWHQAALRENRFKAFEDFEAVARDVVNRGFTSPERLAIHGGSNGGLLTGSVLTRHPELFGAVLIGVPLLDMKRYHKLLAGASWMAEYGNPEDSKDWSFLKFFSPYQNVERGRTYPPVLLYTSTKDDRVHPGHARKMVARLKEFGYRVDYYENMEGGHAGVSNNKQQAYLTGLLYSYLWDKLS
ncbi:MAG: prolyl oligopeptidase family serine peptidase [Vulcanimicrobiota bacterium]